MVAYSSSLIWSDVVQIEKSDDVAHIAFFHVVEFRTAEKGAYLLRTWTLDSGKLIFSATSSRMKTSGYRVLLNKDSRTSNCWREKVVRSRLCFLTEIRDNRY